MELKVRWVRGNPCAVRSKLNGLNWEQTCSKRAETAMAAIVFLERGEELRFAKIGPQSLRDDEFGVGNLPEEKVADTHFTTGADE